jgi:hypothetical protein
MSERPDWLDAGCDLLKEKLGDHAADLLEAGLEAVEMLEEGLRHSLRPPLYDELLGYIQGRVAIVARARGETPDQVIARLTPESLPESLPESSPFRIAEPGSVWYHDRDGNPMFGVPTPGSVQLRELEEDVARHAEQLREIQYRLYEASSTSPRRSGPGGGTDAPLDGIPRD